MANQAIKTSQYPSCVVNMNLRFEEKLFVRVREGTGIQNEPLVTAPNNGVFVMNRVPKKCTINLQGHTQAATYKLVFDYKEFPVDPRTIVAATAEIHMGTVSPEDFSTGIQRPMVGGYTRSILQTRDENGHMIEDNLIMIGPIDNWKTDFSESTGEVHMEGRDLRGMLLDSPLVSFRDLYDPTHTDHHGFPQRRRRRSNILQRLNTQQNIRELVQQIISEHDELRRLPESCRIQVVAFPEEWPEKTLPSPGQGSHIPRHRRGAGGGGGASGGNNGMNFWDLITRYCFLVGGIPSLVGRTLYIRYGSALFDNLSNRTRTPFHPNDPRKADGDTWNVRRMVYGRDVSSMSIERKYAGHNKPKAVRCISVDPHGGRGRGSLIEATYPPRTIREARAEGFGEGGRNPRDAVGGQESSEVLNVPVRRVTDRVRLRQIAYSIWEQIGRQEIKGEVSTSRITSFGGTNADPDLLRLRVGDTVELLVDAAAIGADSAIVSTLNRTAGAPFAEAVEEVRRRLGDVNLSRAIVASARGNVMGVLRYFYVSGVDLDWSEDGVEVKFDFQNYWTPRWDEETRQRTSPSAHGTAHHNGTVRHQTPTAPSTGVPHTRPNLPPSTWRTASESSYADFERRQATPGANDAIIPRGNFLNTFDNPGSGSRWRR